MPLKGQRKTDYMREYMRRRRGSVGVRARRSKPGLPIGRISGSVSVSASGLAESGH